MAKYGGAGGGIRAAETTDDAHATVPRGECRIVGRGYRTAAMLSVSNHCDSG